MLNGKSKDFSDKHWTEVEVRVYEKVSILLSPFSCSSKSYRKSLFNPLPSSSSLHPSEKNVYAHHTSLLRSCVLRLDLAFNLKVGPSYHHPFHLFPSLSFIFSHWLSTTPFHHLLPSYYDSSLAHRLLLLRRTAIPPSNSPLWMISVFIDFYHFSPFWFDNK